MKPGNHKHAVKAENITHIILYTLSVYMPGEPADNVDCPLFVFPL